MTDLLPGLQWDTAGVGGAWSGRQRHFKTLLSLITVAFEGITSHSLQLIYF